MIDPAVQAAMVTLVIFLLRALFIYLGWLVSDEVLTAIAIAIVGFILGVPAGAHFTGFLRRKGILKS